MITTHEPGRGAATQPAKSSTRQRLTEIAADTYLYGYPLVLMDITRRLMSNVEAPRTHGGTLGAPLNQFAHVAEFPDPSFTAVVRPNADTLYSTMFYDVRSEPLIVDVPDSGDRFYLLPMLDMWTDVFASPGKRTTGTGRQTLAIIGPDWHGELPAGVTAIRSPTPFGWVLGRTQTDGKADYDAVHAFQAGLTARPLSLWHSDAELPRGEVDPTISSQAPSDQVAAMTAATYFARLAELMIENPPHANDYPIVECMERLGIVAGRAFDPTRASADARAALAKAPGLAKARLQALSTHLGTPVNGWSIISNPIGTYGTDYLKRALVAAMGLGANTIEDAIYPLATADSDGRPFDSSSRYRMHFTPDQIPPVRAFWSLTMYDERQLFTENPIDRYAIGDRDDLQLGDDGSLDLLIQRQSPGQDHERNWLPAPAAGGFSLNLRLYWPGPEALDGTWVPPRVERVG